MGKLDELYEVYEKDVHKPKGGHARAMNALKEAADGGHARAQYELSTWLNETPTARGSWQAPGCEPDGVMP